ncbi:hypothetical protein K5B08_00900, partial [Candidatus Carsonella ruddii]|nr:hypothetical protein [Candidatus Carsonella ruddii]
MFIHKFKKILILKKIKINSFIKKIFFKNFFFLENKNTIFVSNYFKIGLLFEELFKFNYKKYILITNNIN